MIMEGRFGLSTTQQKVCGEPTITHFYNQYRWLHHTFVAFIDCECIQLSPEAFFLPFTVDREDISEETEETIDQVAVLTSNILFFIVMFIFAVFETYVFL